MNVIIKKINGREVFVNHGRIYILLASGAGAMTVKLEEANEDELKFAVGPDCEIECDLVKAFKEATAETAEETETTDSAIDDFMVLPADQFIELVGYAKRHNNKFPQYSKFGEVNNANDVYCSALIRLTRFWSEDTEKKAFKIFENAMDDKVIKMITVLQAASTAVRDSGGDMQTFFCIKEVIDAYMSTL